MATEVLEAIVQRRVISRDVHHDLESFIWVIIYAIYKHTILDTTLDSKLHGEVAQEFKEYFGGGTLREILVYRSRAQNTQPQLRACHPTDGVLNFLLLRCSRMLHDQNQPYPATARVPKLFRDEYASQNPAHVEPDPVVNILATHDDLETMLLVALRVLTRLGL
jgi:hypothetical protein